MDTENKWKQAIWLFKFEGKHSLLNMVLLIVIFLLALMLVAPSMPDYIQNPTMGVDFFFIVFCTTVLSWTRTNEFIIQKQGNGRYASNFVINLNQLPIQKDVITAYRLLSHSIISIPFLLLFLATLYVLTPALQAEMSIGTYIVFIFIWLCFSVSLGSTNLISEAGTNIFISILIAILLAIPVLYLYTFLFYKWFPNGPRGLVNWTIYIANHYPIPAIVISFFLAIIGSTLSMKRMAKKMRTFDYF